MSWLSLLPPILAIAIAIVRREVILALLCAIFSAELILSGANPFQALLASIERIVAVADSADNVRILLFSLMIGALLQLIRYSGGVQAFVHWLLDTGLARGKRSVGLLTCGLGSIIFIESNLSILACGTFAQRLFDRFGMSRARLALLVDATCSPVSVLLLLNGWGAFVLGLLESQALDNPVQTLLASIPLNFYALLVLGLAWYTAFTGKVYGPLAGHEAREETAAPDGGETATGKVRYFLLPMIAMVGGIIAFMIYTGGGNLIEGSGARSVLYAIIAAILLIYGLLLVDRVADHKTLLGESYKGMAELLPVVTILLLAFALSAAMADLGTGPYIASLIPQSLPAWLLAPAVFIAGCLISFTTGTSWGTFGILVPVVIPVALATGVSPALLLAAVMGGGVFGDHCSPISDSSVLSSLASGCEHLLHIRTQLPYALAAGAATLVLLAVAGLLLG